MLTLLLGAWKEENTLNVHWHEPKHIQRQAFKMKKRHLLMYTITGISKHYSLWGGVICSWHPSLHPGYTRTTYSFVLLNKMYALFFFWFFYSAVCGVAGMAGLALRYSRTKTCRILLRFWMVERSKFCSLSLKVCHTDGKGEGIRWRMCTPDREPQNHSQLKELHNIQHSRYCIYI